MVLVKRVCGDFRLAIQQELTSRILQQIFQ